MPGRNRSTICALAAVLLAAVAVMAAQERSQPSPPDSPQFTASGKLTRPGDYRRWIYLSSGFGMSYNPNAGGNGAPAFTNVFVNPAAYDYFQANGKWPDQTTFVLEIYGSSSKGSINKSGSFQSDFMGLDVEVKDEARFPDKWAYFNFDGDETTAGPTKPARNDCWSVTNRTPPSSIPLCSFIPRCSKSRAPKEPSSPA